MAEFTEEELNAAMAEMAGGPGQPIDAFTADEIEKAMRDLQKQQYDPSVFDYMRQGVQSATLGASDEMIAGLDYLTGGNYQQRLEYERDQLKKTQQAAPVASAASQLVGALPMMLIPGSQIANARNMGLIGKTALSGLGAMGAGAAQGFATGETPEQRLEQAKRQGMLSGIIGAAAPGVVQGAGRLASALTAGLRDMRGTGGAIQRAVTQTVSEAPESMAKARTKLTQAQAQGAPVGIVDAGDNPVLREAILEQTTVRSPKYHFVSKALDARKDMGLARLGQAAEKVGPPAVKTRAGQGIKLAAQKLVGQKKAERAAAMSDDFAKARAANPIIQVPNLEELKKLDDFKDAARWAQHKSVDAFDKGETSPEFWEAVLNRLSSEKRRIAKNARGASPTSSDADVRNISKVYEKVKNSLKGRADELLEAKAKYADLSDELNELTDGNMALVGQIARMRPDQKGAVVTRIFKPSESDPESIAKLKDIFEDVDPEAWRSLVYAKVDDMTNLKNISEGSLDKMLEGKDADLLKAAMGDDLYEEFADVVRREKLILGGPRDLKVAARQAQDEQGIRNRIVRRLEKELVNPEPDARMAQELAQALTDPAYGLKALDVAERQAPVNRMGTRLRDAIFSYGTPAAVLQGENIATVAPELAQALMQSPQVIYETAASGISPSRGYRRMMEQR